MTFASEAQRKWWFANNSSGAPSGTGSDSFPGSSFSLDTPGNGFTVMTAEEISSANIARNDSRIYQSDDSADAAHIAQYGDNSAAKLDRDVEFYKLNK